ncbi:uncharacterized protein LOC114522356 [Dendronephthya gigantea]|uniref:uncharacterized protein LOC114522356 n=1 Tax=Dendronephthya gigantea TaxID=151771 RepID=UPI00106AC09A|nr:uncharacterized protein LOC114522356 [Dendronephthya gigantea]
MFGNSGSTLRDIILLGHRSISERFYPDGIKKGDPELCDIRQRDKFRGRGERPKAIGASSRYGENYHDNLKKSNHRVEVQPSSGPPFWGGVFEAMIKSAKKALRAIVGEADITDEELHTAMCAVEGLLTSRPITYVSSDPNDLTPLTPNHFIVGQLGGQFAAEAVDEEEYVKPTKRWRRVQQLIGQFWKRWIREFLPSLNIRNKWYHHKRNLKEGDVVLVVEANAKRGD